MGKPRKKRKKGPKGGGAEKAAARDGAPKREAGVSPERAPTGRSERAPTGRSERAPAGRSERAPTGRSERAPAGRFERAPAGRPGTESPELDSPVTRAHWLQACGVMLLVAIIGLGFTARVTPSLRSVFPGDDKEVRLLGADAYYHLRHIRSAAEHWPSLLRWDPSTHYPYGQRSQNAGVFDWIAGALVAATSSGERATDREVATVAAWLPPILATVTVLLLFSLGYSLVGGAAGLAMAAVFTLYPGATVTKMLLGFADHHALEVTLLSLLTWLLARGVGGAANARRSGVLLGGALSLYFFSWGGAAILVAIAALSLAVVWVVDVLAGRAPERVSSFSAIAFATFAGLTLAIGLAFPNAVIIETLFWPAVAGGALTSGLAWRSPRLAAVLLAGQPRRRWAALLVIVLPVLGLVVLGATSKGVGQALAIALGPKLRTVAEHAGATPALLVDQYGVLLLAGIAMAIAAVPRALRSSERRGELAVVVVGACVAAIYLASKDYDYLLAPLVAAVAVLGAFAGWAWLSTAIRPLPSRAVAGLAIAVVIASPIAKWTKGPFAEKPVVEALLFYDQAWHNALTWLRERTSPPTMDLDQPVGGWGHRSGGFHYPEGTYGVIVPWSWGNFVAAIGRRPVRWSQGVSQALAQWLVESDERRAFGRLRAGLEKNESFRYLIVDARTMGDQLGALFEQAGISMRPQPVRGRIILQNQRLRLHKYDERFDNALITRLFIGDGAELEHFRLAYETPDRHLIGYRMYKRGGHQKVGRFAMPVDSYNEAELERIADSRLPTHHRKQGFVYDSHLGASIKIFEIVDGAILRGQVAPYREVFATLELEVAPTGRKLTYRRHAKADERGRFELRVAYPTESSSEDGAVAARPYQLQVVGSTGVIEVEVSEADVREGREVAVESQVQTQDGSL